MVATACAARAKRSSFFLQRRQGWNYHPDPAHHVRKCQKAGNPFCACPANTAAKYTAPGRSVPLNPQTAFG